MMTKEKIYVSKKILADVGRGIYRTPANAIKELVSNAFDACATWIKITTNAPYYDVFTCEDNGKGMSSDEFREILQRIGSSTKRAHKKEFTSCKDIQRPLIGKIGIGLLAVSQICNGFTVISKKKGKTKAFKATIDILQFEKDDAYFSGEKDIPLGEFDMDDTIPVSDEEIPLSFTKIIMEPLKEGFQEDLIEEFRKQIIKPKEVASKEFDYSSFVKKVSELKDFKPISKYDYMIWELGFLCPIKYLKGKDVIFPSVKFIRKDIERLNIYNFRLLVDGLEIYKPILFSKGDKIERENQDYKIYHLPQFDKEVGGEQLKFRGYIYSQRVKIKPESCVKMS